MDSSQELNKKTALELLGIEEDYTKYIDSSDMMKSFYNSHKITNQEQLFYQIETWLEGEEIDKSKPDWNTPLIITGPSGAGKKALLVKWMEYHEKSSTKTFPDKILSHFSCANKSNKNCILGIYRVQIKLRTILNFKQKVELLEEKLRVYFDYYLKVCEREIKKKVMKDMQIILIFEGIDNLIDSRTHVQAIPKFWLPRCFPERIRVILTCKNNYKALKYFQNIEARIIELQAQPAIIQEVFQTIQNNLDSNEYLSEEIKSYLKNGQLPKIFYENYSFYQTFIHFFLPENLQFTYSNVQQRIKQIYSNISKDQISQLNSLEELYEMIFDAYSKQNGFEFNKVLNTIRFLMTTEKGLQLQEILKLLGMQKEDFQFIFIPLQEIIIHYQNFYKISNLNFIHFFGQKYGLSKELQIELHDKLQNAMSKSSMSLRKIEEETYHQLHGKQYFKLKENVSIMEHFLLLYHPENRFFLCSIWQKLEEQGFDCIAEYNKSIEQFEMHFHPTSENLFILILQLSRFFREFGDFETYFAPQFRHPPIVGGKEIAEIGLSEEAKNFNLYEEKSNNKEKPIKKETVTKQQKTNQQTQQTQNKQALNEEEQTNSQGILSKLESLNVDIPTNKNQIRKNYIKQMQEFENQQLLFEKLKQLERMEQSKKFKSQVSQSKLDDVKMNDEFEKIQTRQPNNIASQDLNQNEVSDFLSQKQPSEYIADDQATPENTQENNNKQQYLNFSDFKFNALPAQSELSNLQLAQKLSQNENNSNFYYYKRWLWIIFPWACISPFCEFQKVIKKCIINEIHSLKVENEEPLNSYALQIAIEAKIKKKLVLTNIDNLDEKPAKCNQESSLKLSKLKILKDKEETKNQKNNRADLPYFQGHSTDRTSNLLKSKRTRLDNLKNLKIQDQSTSLIFQTQPQNDLTRFQPQSVRSQQHYGFDTNTSKHMMSKQSIYFEKPYSFEFQSKKYTDNQSNVKISQKSLLPNLHKSILDHNNQELKILQKQVADIKAEYDRLVYDNNALQKKLNQVTIIKNNFMGAAKEQEIRKNYQLKIEQIQQSIIDVEKSYNKSNLHKTRIKKLLFICRENKIQNEEWIRALNYLHQNQQKFLNQEKQESQKLKVETENLRKIYKKSLETYENQTFNHSKIIEQIQKDVKQKYYFDEQFVEGESIINKTLIDNSKEFDDKSQFTNAIQQQQKEQKQQNQDQTKANNKNIPSSGNIKIQQQQVKDQQQIVKQQFDEISNLLGFNDMKSKILNNQDLLFELPAYKNFKNQKEISNKWEEQLYEYCEKIQKLKVTLDKKRETLLFLEKSNISYNTQTNENEKQIYEQIRESVLKQYNDESKINELNQKVQESQKNLDKLLEQQQKYMNSKLDSIQIFNSILNKLSLQGNVTQCQEIKFDLVFSILEEKIKILKEKLSEEDFFALMENRYDFKEFYDKIAPIEKNVTFGEQHSISHYN